MIMALLMPIAGCYTFDPITYRETILVQDFKHTASNNFYVFHEGEKNDFEYDKVALIEVIAPVWVDEKQMLDKLAFEAWQLGGNGVVLLNKKYHSLTKDEVMLNWNTWGRRWFIWFGPIDWIFRISQSHSKLYKIYQCLAVRIEADSDFVARNGNGYSMKFVESEPIRHAKYDNQVQLRRQQKLLERKNRGSNTNGEKVASVVFFGAIVGLVVYILVREP